MVKELRFKKIITALKKNGRITLDELAKLLDVSADTIRRDIDVLSKKGLVVKVRGGAMSPMETHLTYQDRSTLYSEPKNIISLKALYHLKSAKTIFLDGGTTVTTFATKIPIDSNLRIITNNMDVIPVLERHKNIELIILGGKFFNSTKTTFGQQTIDEINKYWADIFIMSPCSIDPKIGITSEYEEDGEVKKTFISRSKKTIILCNKEKINKIDFFVVGNFNDIDTLITELPSNDKQLDQFRQFDIEIF